MLSSAQIRPWVDGCDAHFSHVPLNRFSIDHDSFSAQLRFNFSRAVKGIRRVDLINAMFDGDLFCRRLLWLIVDTGTTHTQQFCLLRQWQLTACSFGQSHTLLMAQS
jgi:hypothetical protein